MAREVSGIKVTVDLHKRHALVSTSANIPGAATTILTMRAGDNQVIYWPNDLPLQLKLFGVGGAGEVAHESEISLWKISPGRKDEKLLGTKAYAAWRNTPFSDQSIPDRQASLAIPFHEEDKIGASVPSGFWLELRLNATVVVNWDNPDTQFFAAVGQDIIS